MADKKLLYISMLGESSLYHLDDYKQICPSGLEKDWIVAWHGNLAKKYGFDMESADIIRGDILPPPDQISAAILGGTIHLILEDRFWLKKCLKWLQEYRKLQRPLLGICGGHQMIAVNFFNGNKLIKRRNGLLAGTYKIQLSEAGKDSALFQSFADQPQFNFANSYHIIPAAETDMNILATTEDSPAVAADYGGHWFGCQFHPETRKETWNCYFKRDSAIDLSKFKSDHGGVQLLDNFLKLSRICA